MKNNPYNIIPIMDPPHPSMKINIDSKLRKTKGKKSELISEINTSINISTKKISNKLKGIRESSRKKPKICSEDYKSMTSGIIHSLMMIEFYHIYYHSLLIHVKTGTCASLSEKQLFWGKYSSPLVNEIGWLKVNEQQIRW